MLSAHGAEAFGGAEIELLISGGAVMALAFVFRFSGERDARAALITLIVGIALLVGAFALPRASAAPLPSAPLVPRH